ncbi:hypothetical protein ES705_21675 [subsurface metagenome]
MEWLIIIRFLNSNWIVLAVIVAIIYFVLKKDGNSGYEEGQKQFEEDNFLGQYYGKKEG